MGHRSPHRWQPFRIRASSGCSGPADATTYNHVPAGSVTGADGTTVGTGVGWLALLLRRDGARGGVMVGSGGRGCGATWTGGIEAAFGAALREALAELCQAHAATSTRAAPRRKQPVR